MVSFIRILRTLRSIKYHENLFLFPFKYLVFLLSVGINCLKNMINLKLEGDKKVDVLLINPPRWEIQINNSAYTAKRFSKEEPIGLTTISAFLKTKGVTTRILDWNVEYFSLNMLKRYIQKLTPKVVGISAITLQIKKAYWIGNYIKRNFPEIKLVYGGVHPTFFPEEPFNLGSADFVVVGEGERTFLELVDTIKRNNDDFKIEGLVYKDSNRIKINQPRKLIEDLNDIPLPDRTSLPMDRYSTNLHLPLFDKEKAFPIMTSRGCPFNCSYCAIPNIWMRKFRQRSPEQVIKEIKQIVSDYGVNNFHFYDDDFFINTDFIKKMCELIIKEGLRIKWLCQTGSSTLVKNSNILPLMRKAGCVIIELGIESCDNRVLNKTNKPETVKDIRNAINLLRQNNIQPLILMMSFNTGENLDSVYNTTLLLEELKLWGVNYLLNSRKYINAKSPVECNGTPYSHGFFATPIPGSRFYTIAKEKGMMLMESWNDCYFQRINFIPDEFLNDTPTLVKKINRDEFCNYINKFRPVIEHYLRYLNGIVGNFYRVSAYKEFLFYIYKLSGLNNGLTVKGLSELIVKKYKKENIATICLGFRFLAMLKLIRSSQNKL